MTTKGLDITAILQNAFHLFKGKLTNPYAGPCDGTVLKMHYRWAFYFTLGGFFTVWYGWYFGRVIHCVSTFKGDQEARSDYQNVCLSYPFIKDENGDQRFILYYRWIHWSFLLLSVIYYLPRKISKSIENSKAKKIIEDLATLSPRYDESKDMIDRATYYMVSNMKTHDTLYYKYLGLNVFALLIDIFVLIFLDYLFHNRYISLIPNAYPFHRDPVNFKDYISQTFPPFASCVLNDAHKIIDGRKEEIGCHLTNMELYEKLFFIFWFINYFLILVTICHIIFISLMLVPSLRIRFMSTPRPFQARYPVHNLISNILHNFQVGDIYMMYRLKQHLKPARYYKMLVDLNHPKYKSHTSDLDEDLKDHKDQNVQIPIDSNIRQRKNSFDQQQTKIQVDTLGPTFANGISKSTKVNDPNHASNLLNKLMLNKNNEEVIQNYHKLLKSKKLENRSILIE